MRSITETAAKVKTLVDEVELGSRQQARGNDQSEELRGIVVRLERMVGGGLEAAG